MENQIDGFSLSSIKSTLQRERGQKILIYGSPGIGKTTFGTTFESPILLRTEDGAAALDIPSFPLAQSYSQVCEAINALSGEHNYKTLVLDSLDWLENIVWAQTCRRLSEVLQKEVPSIETLGYGKGYVEAENEWKYLFSGFDFLQQRKNMHIVLIAHSEVKLISPPDSEPYDRYQIKLHKRAWALCQEWCDMMLFTSYERRIVRSTEQKKVRAEGGGDRIIYTDERPAFLAKNRWGLPSQIRIGQNINWEPFHLALQEATNGGYNYNKKEV